MISINNNTKNEKIHNDPINPFDNEQNNNIDELLNYNYDDKDFDKEDEETNYFNPIIRNSLEYYDSFQPKIQEILNKIHKIKIIDNVNINDEFVFYDIDDKPFFKSRIEQLGMFVPQDNSWKWSWAIPFAKYYNTLISRKILEYAFTLNSSTDLHLKSTLINSKLIISNQYQIDIYLALSSMLSKKPFILKYYLLNTDQNKENKIYYKKILNDPNRKKFISVYVLLIDYEPDN
jgi:hypothetical protein